MLKDVGMTMPKSTRTRCRICGQEHDDGMRNKEQHEGKGKGWACNNHNMRNLTLYLLYNGVTHVMIPIPCLCLYTAPYFSCRHPSVFRSCEQFHNVRA